MGTMLDLELSTLSTLNEDREGTGSLCVLDETGDSRMQWDRNDSAQVAAARAKFDEMKARRFLAYKVNGRGNQGEVIDQFDPSAERIILHQQLVGG